MKAAISILGVQNHIERFGEKVEDREELPRVAPWRCNLTGLSQRCNLLFTAFTGDIHVYEPQFPSQALPSQPALTIITPPSQPGLTGSLDSRNPRAINYLVIQNLGHEEILATARDDGDIEVYLVAHIIHAVERRASGDMAAEVRPFLQRNVGLSAWGIAVHSAARIVAVSSNSHNVTIFKFGLVGGVEDRREDVEQEIVIGAANIPCVAFCNTEDDLEGKWLITTDIVGTTRVIDLKNARLAKRFSFAEGDVALGYDRYHAGWGVMYLDRRSFVEDHSFDAALGVGHTWKGRVWDLSHTVSSRTALPSTHDCVDVEPDEISSTRGSFSSGDETSLSSEFSDDGDPDDNDAATNGNTLFNPRLYQSIPGAAYNLPCPVLHTSVNKVYLLQPPLESQDPLIGFAKALPKSDHLSPFDRLNMHASIPSLGIIILASQAGSAMVLALTKVKVHRGEMFYGMRIDAILPTGTPKMPLMGIAVGPMQGCEGLRDGDERKRWRLLMSYYDFTVMSYEIARDGVGEEKVRNAFEVGIERIVV